QHADLLSRGIRDRDFIAAQRGDGTLEDITGRAFFGEIALSDSHFFRSKMKTLSLPSHFCASLITESGLLLPQRPVDRTSQLFVKQPHTLNRISVRHRHVHDRPGGKPAEANRHAPIKSARRSATCAGVASATVPSTSSSSPLKWCPTFLR